jgi:hypothetical protein
MTKKLSKNEVVELLIVWKKWMNGPEPAKNIPQEFKIIYRDKDKHLRIIFGIILHMYLSFLTKIGQKTRLNSLSIWASQKRIEYDQLWFEPHSCGLTGSYTDLGIGYLETGAIDNAIDCLDSAWRVYPCPHNTSFGIKLKLYKRLRDLPEAQDAVTEYKEMWYKFKGA